MFFIVSLKEIKYMEKSGEHEQINNKIAEIKTFSVPFSSGEIKENIAISTNTPSKSSKEQIINQAIKFHSQGNISEAAKLYQYLISEGCNDHRVFSNYGTILKDHGKLKEAEISTRKAIKINPYLADSYYNLGNILRDLGNLQEAEICQRKAIEINPEFALAYFNLGNILNALGRLQEAEIFQRKAIKVNPNFAKAYSNLGSILSDLDKLKDAKFFTSKAIQLNPDFAEAHYNLGIILKNLGKLKEAEFSLQKAINIKASSDAYFALASCLYEKKEFNYALENLFKAREIIGDESLSKCIEAAILITNSAKNISLNSNGLMKGSNFFNKEINRLVLSREVEDKLVSYLYTIKTRQLDNTRDTRYGAGVCSDFNLFDDTSPNISKLSNDIKEICKNELGLKKIFFCDSFINIFVSGSGQPPHCHLTLRDKNFNLASKKYSLVYYLEIGDQDCEIPGILKLHEPDEDILPEKGMIIIIGAERFHSVSYCGKKKRLMLGVNFYGI